MYRLTLMGLTVTQGQLKKCKACNERLTKSIMARIVILGAGIGGKGTNGKRNERNGRKNHDVIVISDIPRFSFCSVKSLGSTPKKIPLPVGAPKTGHMIESMVTASAHNIADELVGKEPIHKATWNALCLADFGDSGVAFLAIPQISPRNTTWLAEGKWVHLAKVVLKNISCVKYEKASVNLFMKRPCFLIAVWRTVPVGRGQR